MRQNLVFIRRMLFIFYAWSLSLLDFFVPKKENVWIIASSSGMVGNTRFFAEYLLEKYETKRIYYYALENSDTLKLTEDYFRNKFKGRVTIYKKKNLMALITACRAKYIFISHDVMRDIGFPLGTLGGRRAIINLWHGIASKKHWLIKRYKGFTNHKRKAGQFSSIIASSAVDAAAKAAIFHKPLEDIWITGNPRNDILINKNNKLPQDLLQQEKGLLDQLNGRTLVLYAPTWRSYQDQFEPFDDQCLQKMTKVLESNQAVLGLRMHEKDEQKFRKLYDTSPCILNLGQEKYPETQVLLKNTKVLVTDYSSIWLDYLLTDNPVIAYWYDFNSYHKKRGTLWDLAEIFPGIRAASCAELISAIEKTLHEEIIVSEEYQQKYKFVKSLFHCFADGKNTKRLAEKVIYPLSRDSKPNKTGDKEELYDR